MNETLFAVYIKIVLNTSYLLVSISDTKANISRRFTLSRKNFLLMLWSCVESVFAYIRHNNQSTAQPVIMNLAKEFGKSTFKCCFVCEPTRRENSQESLHKKYYNDNVAGEQGGIYCNNQTARWMEEVQCCRHPR
ncbi:hypothetical protein NQ318_008830 [Aromia moschata]|uniref:Uncharacterized protein n=1 Tax=Aromia moschata TaxID=1265417 RepID=A0AAV8Z9X7_9CUCU|nr:hypothetical protein NQ318_008830 [Aromia moschata]